MKKAQGLEVLGFRTVMRTNQELFQELFVSCSSSVDAEMIIKCLSFVDGMGEIAFFSNILRSFTIRFAEAFVTNLLEYQ